MSKKSRMLCKLNGIFWGRDCQDHFSYFFNISMEIASVILNGLTIYLCTYIEKSFDSEKSNSDENSQDLSSAEIRPLIIYAIFFAINYIFNQLKNYVFQRKVIAMTTYMFKEVCDKAYCLGYDQNNNNLSYNLTKIYGPISNYMSGTLGIPFEILRILTIPTLVSFFYKDYRFGATLISTLLLSQVPTYFSFKYQYPLSEKSSSVFGECHGLAMDGMNRYIDLQLYNKVNTQKELIDRKLHELEISYERTIRCDTLISMLRYIIIGVCYFFMSYFAAKALRESQVKKTLEFDMDDFLLINMFTLHFIIALLGTPDSITKLIDGLQELNKVVDFLDIPYEPIIAGNILLDQKQAPLIEFKNVFFQVSNNNILNNLNFSIKPGEKIAIVGPSNCGKSTIAKLIMRFLTPTKGNIYFNKKSIVFYDLASLRNNIRYAPQSPNIIPGTVRDNILYASHDCRLSDAQINAVLIKVGLEIVTLDQDASALSGGQKQRLAAAKLILRGSPVVILDEITAALDSRKENAIMSNLFEIIGEGKTAIFITHQLRTICSVDRIIVLNEKGEIDDIGSFNELNSKILGTFRELYSAQNTELVIRKKVNLTEALCKKISNEYHFKAQFGSVYNDEDSFFEAICQTLNHHNGSDKFTASNLRNLCGYYVNNSGEKDPWINELFSNDKLKKEYLNTIRISLPLKLKFSHLEHNVPIIAARAEIEGRIICAVLDIVIYLIKANEVLCIDSKGSRKIDATELGTASQEKLYIYQHEDNQFAPLLSLVFTKQADLYSSNDNNNAKRYSNSSSYSRMRPDYVPIKDPEVKNDKALKRYFDFFAKPQLPISQSRLSQEQTEQQTLLQKQQTDSEQSKKCIIM